MSVANFKPAYWSATVLRVLNNKLVGKKICNMDYMGEIRQKGDTVFFPGLGDVSISDYDGTALTYENIEDSSLQMKIEQQKSYSFLVDDIDAAQASVDFKTSQIKQAAYQLQRAADTHIMSLYGGAQAGTVTDTTCDTDTIIDDIGLLWQYLAENNVPDGEMWLTIPPWVKLKLMEAGISFSINEGIKGEGGISWAKELGFDIYVTNQVYNSGSVASPVSHLMAGSFNAIGFADQVYKTEAFRHQSYFKDACRGLYTYQAKVLKPKELATATLTYTAE